MPTQVCYPSPFVPKAKMSQEDRLAAGWTECFGVWHERVGWWQGNQPPAHSTSWAEKTIRRHDFGSIDAAKTFLLEQRCNQPTKWRRFWRKRKPSALRNGDVVTVSGKICELNLSGGRVEIFTGTGYLRVSEQDIKRVVRP